MGQQLHRQQDIGTDGVCCFNHVIGLPRKDADDKPLCDYQQIIFDSLDSGNKHLWIKKTTSFKYIIREGHMQE